MYRIAIISYHTSPLASLGGAETGGLNVYVRALASELAERGHTVDVFTRRTDAQSPTTLPIAEEGAGSPLARVVQITAGPSQYEEKDALPAYVDEFTEGVATFVADEGATYDIILQQQR